MPRRLIDYMESEFVNVEPMWRGGPDVDTFVLEWYRDGAEVVAVGDRAEGDGPSIVHEWRVAVYPAAVWWESGDMDADGVEVHYAATRAELLAVTLRVLGVDGAE